MFVSVLSGGALKLLWLNHDPQCFDTASCLPKASPLRQARHGKDGAVIGI